MASNLMGVLDFPSAAAGRPVWVGPHDSGRLAAYPAVATSQLSTVMTGSERVGGSSLGCVFGVWPELLVGTFGAFEIIVDQLTLKRRAMIEVTSFAMHDVLVRRGQLFAKATGATG
jgi:hypothetical protein